ncbi:hypothetical protein JG687_00003016 [Phytophthora cactorum]|uniref:Uncharacterized protein n=2 Tax=Phytophthora cactorum TaxID=29920 RepID=A0A329S9Q2_9STRA|nr:hypothetical protein Pcac1_g23328 [Phytophthora cactorum]KAG2834727.1 hypothetical protein PC112_g5979 [Phytophthora cactorum]KAG2934612.1 hypothetical protein PC115_g5085 [Phytophthora cactorum]KAG3083667.1 hypothetical protein PC121_g5644 [Phytophthora cactorum]KAG3093553.1 hypothetical protein PC122_g6136 [Phytophthora cactorum]
MPAMEVGAPAANAAAAAASRAHAELPGHMKELLGASARLNIPLELKILSALVMLFLFLLFLIMVLWDRYGKEIGELYTSPMGTTAQGQNTNDVKVHDVADEFSIYQKLPTFFYEYMPRRKKRD